MKKIYSHIFMLAALLMAGAAFVSCEKENNPGDYTMTVKATKGGSGAKALSEDGASISATWAVNDEVQVYNGATLLGTLTAQSAGETTTLRGNLEGTVLEGDVLTLKFLSPNYGTQNGTLEHIATNCDYAVASVTVTAIDGSGNISTDAPASFQNQQAIFKFTVKNSDGSATIDVTSLTVTIDAQDYVITPASATSTLYVALPAISGQTVTFTATGSDSKTFTCSKDGVTFAAGKYYQSTLKMAITVPVVDLSAYSGTYNVDRDVILTGTPSGNLSIQYNADNCEVTLDNVNSAGTRNINIRGQKLYNVNVKLKGTSRLSFIVTTKNITIGEAEAGGTLILNDDGSPIDGSTVTINGGTVKAKTTDTYGYFYAAEVKNLVINGGNVYLAGRGSSGEAVDVLNTVSGSVTLYG